MMWIPVAMMAVGSVMGAVGSIAQGNAAASAAAANADILRRRAQQEQQLGEAAYADQKRKGLIARGHSLAALSAASVDPGVGSPLDLLCEQAKETEYAANNAKFEHDEKAWTMRVNAIQQEQSGAAAQSQGLFKGISTLFMGMGSAGMGAFNLMKPAAGGPYPNIGALVQQQTGIPPGQEE